MERTAPVQLKPFCLTVNNTNQSREQASEASAAHKFIITCKEKGEPAKDWLICWTYKAAIMQALYRQKITPQHTWGVRTVRSEHEPARAKWLRENPSATPNQIYNFAPSSSK